MDRSELVQQKPGAPPAAACPLAQDLLASGVPCQVRLLLVLGPLTGLRSGEEGLSAVGPPTTHCPQPTFRRLGFPVTWVLLLMPHGPGFSQGAEGGRVAPGLGEEVA